MLGLSHDYWTVFEKHCLSRMDPWQRKLYYDLKRRKYMKVYAKGCDAPGCSQEAEVDQGLGRPADWYFVTVDGGAIPQGLRRTLIVCQKCYRNSGVEDLASGLMLGAAARAAGVVT